MFEILINFLEIYVLPLGFFGVFFASIIEEVVAPIPSALIMTMAGFIFVKGLVSFDSVSILILKVALPSALGITIGSYFIFFISKFGGKFVIEKWGKFIGLYWSDIESMKLKLSGTKKDDVIVCLARILPIIPSVAISAFCGIFGMNIFRYALITFVGVFIRGMILGFVGWQVGNVYQKYAHLLSKIESIFLIFIAIVIFVFIVVKYKRVKSSHHV